MYVTDSENGDMEPRRVVNSGWWRHVGTGTTMFLPCTSNAVVDYTASKP